MTLVSKGPPLPPEVAAELKQYLDRKPLKLNITREWFERRVALEDGFEIGAGLREPDPLATALADLQAVRGERDEAHLYLDRCGQSRTEGGTDGNAEETLTLKGRIMNLVADRQAAEADRDEAQAECARWLSRMADVREASGIGVKPMLSEIPAALAALKADQDGLRAALEKIADGSVGPEKEGHYLAHRKAVEIARAALHPKPQSPGTGGGS